MQRTHRYTQVCFSRHAGMDAVSLKTISRHKTFIKELRNIRLTETQATFPRECV